MKTATVCPQASAPVARIDLQPRDVHLWSDARSRARPRHSEAVVITRHEYRRLQLMQGVLLFILLGLLPGLLLASPVNLPDDIRAGRFFMQSGDGQIREAMRMNSQVKIGISGLVARTRVIQTFSNDSSIFMEGVYVFPLPDNAAVDRLRIHVGERVIEGVIKAREQAKKIYQQARASGRRTALVEQERPNLFTTSVANIGPHETVRVEISYQQTLAYRDGRFSLRFPMTLTPRYIPGQAVTQGTEKLSVSADGWARNTDQVPDAARITPPVKRLADGSRNRATIDISLDAGFPLSSVESLYHDVRVDRDQRVYNIRLQQGQVPMDRDFELVWQPAVGTEPNAAYFRQSLDGEDYGLIMLMPPHADAAMNESQRALPREMIFIIDTSGSMAGASLQQAKQALSMALDTLSASDRFNVIEFNSVTRKLFSQAVFADSQSINLAMQYIHNLQADGGTEMAPALLEALQGDELEGHVKQVIFMTDGSVGNEDALFRLIENNLHNSRLFTVAIGSAPNSYFMRKAAQFGRGTHTFISSERDIVSRMQALFERLQKPVLSGLRLHWSGDDEPEYWPKRLPDLYAAELLLITARLAQPSQQLTLEGDIQGRHWKKTLDLQASRSREGIAALWARNKISGLMDQQRGSEAADDLRQQIIQLALRHQLVSRYTSLVAVDPLQSRSRHDASGKQLIAGLLPAGSQQDIQGYGLPQGATASRLHVLSGMVALCMALVFAGLRQRNEK